MYLDGPVGYELLLFYNTLGMDGMAALQALGQVIENTGALIDRRLSPRNG